MSDHRAAAPSVLIIWILLGMSCTTVSPAAEGQATWVDRAEMTRPRLFHFAGVGSDGRIAAVAGKVAIKPNNGTVPGVGDRALDIYDPETNTWKQGPAAPDYVGIRRKYVIYHDPTNRDKVLSEGVEEYPFKMRHDWEYVPGVGGRDGRIYWFSKRGPIYFDPAANMWGQGEPVLYDYDAERYTPPVANWFRLAGATAAGPDGKLYLVGGTGYPTIVGSKKGEPYRVLDSIEIYDPATRTWKEGTKMVLPRQMMAAAFAPDGKLYVFGGFAALGTHVKLPDESDARFAARVRLDDRFARGALRFVQAYDPATDTWEDRAPMPAGRQSMGAALGADGRIYVIGGADQYSNPAPKAEVFIYDPKMNTWSEGPPLNHPRYHHAVVATPDGRIWAIGGTNGTNRWGALPRGEEEGLVRPIEMLETRPVLPMPSTPEQPR